MKREQIFLIDRSSSVYKNKDKILSFYKDELNEDGLISLALFSDELDVICMRQPGELVKGTLEQKYYNDGNTAVFDAVCGFLEQWDKYLSATGASEADAEMYIVTDGMDNGSVRTDFEMMRQMIRTREKNGWRIKIKGPQIQDMRLDELYTRGKKHGTKQQQGSTSDRNDAER